MVIGVLSWVFFILWQIGRDGKTIPAKIGELIRSLILIQVALIAIPLGNNLGYKPFQIYAVISLLIFFFISRQLAKRFYGS